MSPGGEQGTSNVTLFPFTCLGRSVNCRRSAEEGGRPLGKNERGHWERGTEVESENDGEKKPEGLETREGEIEGGKENEINRERENVGK